MGLKKLVRGMKQEYLFRKILIGHMITKYIERDHKYVIKPLDVPREVVNLGELEAPYPTIHEAFFRKTENLWNDVSVLDLGCNTGYCGRILQSAFRNVDYVGSDNFSLFERCKPEEYQGIKFIEADFNHLPFAPQVQFDRILCFGASPDDLEETASHLKDDGKIIFECSSDVYFLRNSKAFGNYLPSILRHFDVQREIWLTYRFEKYGEYFEGDSVHMICGKR